MQMPAIRRFIDHVSPQLVDNTHVSFHATRIDCLGGNDKELNVEKFSFREDCMDRYKKN